MIHAVTLANQHLHGRQLDQMFRMRHAFYVEGHGWSGLTSKDGRETDEFDNESAIYLMSIDPFGDKRFDEPGDLLASRHLLHASDDEWEKCRFYGSDPFETLRIPSHPAQHEHGGTGCCCHSGYRHNNFGWDSRD